MTSCGMQHDWNALTAKSPDRERTQYLMRVLLRSPTFSSTQVLLRATEDYHQKYLERGGQDAASGSLGEVTVVLQ